jgi:hypothetical protein
VKFSAAFRRDVYRLRPCHEQAEWLQRIRTEPDLEMVELAHIVTAHLRVEQPSMSLARRIVRLALSPSRWLRVLKRKKGETIRRVQKYKGVQST